MKNEKAIESFNKLLNISKNDLEENDNYKPIMQKLKACSVEFNSSLSNSGCSAVEWPNGEGYDFCFYGTKKEIESKFVSLHMDEIEEMLLALIKLDYLKL